ncbi:hypothetical protein EVAR_13911_1 [Eumeta japonica]|uniref:Uncharacterized protein n=1 Tax=Eumeta variegata TaxID=151549 RepID=A0A4C1U8F2_EUMVA|nr:hypothetical protein EVAR_13911_1 [Eumeta japonica]
MVISFKRGRTNLTDNLCEERSSLATTEDNISAVRLMIETDKRVSYQQIRTSLGIAIHIRGGGRGPQGRPGYSRNSSVRLGVHGTRRASGEGTTSLGFGGSDGRAE